MLERTAAQPEVNLRHSVRPSPPNQRLSSIYDLGVIGGIPFAAEQARIRGLLAKRGDWPVQFRDAAVLSAVPLLIRAPVLADARGSASSPRRAPLAKCRPDIRSISRDRWPLSRTDMNARSYARRVHSRVAVLSAGTSIGLTAHGQQNRA